jgi:cytochrome c-type biogenesis protein CcmH
MRRVFTLLFALLLAAPAVSQDRGALDYAEVSLADPAREQQALDLMDTIRCVVCQGQPISGSDAPMAGDMRRIIRERIAAGDRPDDIRAWLVTRYGDWVSFKPVVKPATLPLWLLPLAALLGGLWLVMRRLRLRRG